MNNEKIYKGERDLIDIIKGKKVLYIATKNEDYIRLQQEIEIVKKYSAKCTVIVSNSKSYLKRIFCIYITLLYSSIKSYDIIFIGFMAQMIIPFWKWKFKNKIVIVDFFISVYDTLVDDRKKIRARGLLSKMVHKVDQLTIKDADYIICDTQAHGKYFKKEFNVSQKELITLYLKANSTIYYPMDVKRPEKWNEKFLVLYFGSILPVQGVDIVLKAIELLKNNTNIYFLVIGPIGNKMTKVNANNVTYIDWLPQMKLAEYIAISDLCLAGHFSATVGKANRTIPGKAYIYQAMGKKMILGDSEANREIFDELTGDLYHYVPRGDYRSLSDKINELYKT